MVYPVEELGKVHVHHPAKALPDEALGRFHGLVSASSRTEPVAGVGEVRVEEPAQYLGQGLLNQPVQGCRNTQLPHPVASGFRDFDPSDRAGAVGPCVQGLADGRPVLLEVFRKLVDRHAVDSGGTPVGLDA
ncbi:hypothetical protein D3C78_860570 [compost metagenome]